MTPRPNPGRWPLSGTGLRARIVRPFLLVTSLALIIAVAAFGLALDKILVRAASDAVLTRTDQLVTDISSGDRPQDALSAHHSSGLLVQVEEDGRLVAQTDAHLPALISTVGPDASGRVHARQQVLDLGDGVSPYYVATARFAAHGHTYRIATAAPLKTSGDIIDHAVLALTLVALLLLAASTWGIHRVVSRALAPVERIRSDVDHIRAQGGFDRVRVPATGDEIERLAVTMNDMLTRLESADASQRRFISDASHELRSPLTTIRLLSEMDAATDENAAIINREAIRLQTLVDDMLMLTKATDGHLVLRWDEVDADDIVGSETRRLRRITDAEVTSSLTPVRMVADADKLTQVVRNLLDNAARHAESQIAVALSAQSDEAVLTVDNDGAVVEPAQRERIFERFTRLGEARDRDSGGSGLGLAITAAIVKAHGGSVRTLEAPNGWCRFEVRIPQHPTSAEVTQPPSAGSPLPGPSAAN